MTKAEIVNCLTTDTAKAVKLPDGTLVTEKLAWEAFRRDAAKDAMLGILAGRRSHQGFHETAEEAVSYADALIRQLKLK